MYGPEAVVVVEQPAVFQRPRYPSEGRIVPVEGENSKPEIKTWPSIAVLNYDGVFNVIVSCVEKDRPYRFHRYQFVGPQSLEGYCLEGIFNSADVSTNRAEPTILNFTQLNIQITPKRDFQKMLDERRKWEIDPFRLSGKPDNLQRDIHTFRLCYQVFLRTHLLFKVPIPPILSEPISLSELRISSISHSKGAASGGEKGFVLCSDIPTNQNIRIRFYEEDARNTVIWEDWGRSLHRHNNGAFTFVTPKYGGTNFEEKQNVFLELIRSSDGARSKGICFKYVPDSFENPSIKRKKLKFDDVESRSELDALLSIFLKENETSHPQGDQINTPSTSTQTESRDQINTPSTSTQNESRLAQYNEHQQELKLEQKKYDDLKGKYDALVQYCKQHMPNRYP